MLWKENPHQVKSIGDIKAIQVNDVFIVEKEKLKTVSSPMEFRYFFNYVISLMMTKKAWFIDRITWHEAPAVTGERIIILCAPSLPQFSLKKVFFWSFYLISPDKITAFVRKYHWRKFLSYRNFPKVANLEYTS